MQVYKAFFKVIKKNIIEISIYIVVFLAFSIALGNTNANPEDTDFKDTKINIAFINNDKESKLTEGLKSYISDNANIKDISNDKEKLQDALFFRDVEYIVTVPKGFTDKMLSGDKNVNIEKNTIPNSVSEIYMDNLINKYLNAVKMYTSTLDNLSESQIVEYVSKDLSYSTNVEVKNYNNGYLNNSDCKNYYNYLAYSMFAILILGVGSVMITFNNKDLRMRNLSSALTLRSMNFQIVLGNITYTIVVWGIMVVISFIMYKGYMFSGSGILLLLNSFVFSLAVLSISLLISSVINSRSAMSAIANVVSLGSCFISGVFVPQKYLGENVISMARFNPTYWYVKANDDISLLVNFNEENLVPIMTSILIVFGFALTILAITLVIIKQRRLRH